MLSSDIEMSPCQPCRIMLLAVISITPHDIFLMGYHVIGVVSKPYIQKNISDISSIEIQVHFILHMMSNIYNILIYIYTYHISFWHI